MQQFLTEQYIFVDGCLEENISSLSDIFTFTCGNQEKFDDKQKRKL